MVVTQLGVLGHARRSIIPYLVVAVVGCPFPPLAIAVVSLHLQSTTAVAVVVSPACSHRVSIRGNGKFANGAVVAGVAGYRNGVMVSTMVRGGEWWCCGGNPRDVRLSGNVFL